MQCFLINSMLLPEIIHARPNPRIKHTSIVAQKRANVVSPFRPPAVDEATVRKSFALAHATCQGVSAVFLCNSQRNEANSCEFLQSPSGPYQLHQLREALATRPAALCSHLVSRSFNKPSCSEIRGPTLLQRRGTGDAGRLGEFSFLLVAYRHTHT